MKGKPLILKVEPEALNLGLSRALFWRETGLCWCYNYIQPVLCSPGCTAEGWGRMFPPVVPVAGMPEAQPPPNPGGEHWLHKTELLLLCSFTHHKVMFRITAWFGLERTFKRPSSPTSCHGQGQLPVYQVAPAPCNSVILRLARTAGKSQTVSVFLNLAWVSS